MSNTLPLNASAGQRAQRFPMLTDPQLARIVAAGVEQRFAAGDHVFEQGDVDVPFYVVLEGEIELAQPRDDREELIATVGPKEVCIQLVHRVLHEGR